MAIDQGALDTINFKIEDAVLTERERCARIAESFTKDYGPEVRHMARRIAEVIRRSVARS